VLPAALAAMGIAGETNILGLPPARAYCVLLIDGLGWNLLRKHVAQAPFLGSLLPQGRVLSVGAPSTTATSLASLGTGLPPGRHGVVGYTSRRPGTTDVLLNALTWDPQVDPVRYQPHPTVFERAKAAHVAVSVVSKRQFRDTGLTLAGLRGPRFRGADALGERVAAVAEEVAGPGARLVYVYDGDLDYTGHRHGCESAAWRHQLVQLDRFAEQIYDELAPGTALVVTGDHGMIDVPLTSRIDVDDKPELREGVELVGGEARFRHVYVKAGALADVRALWGDVVGECAVVASREEAVVAGWFGAVETRVLDRIGDLLVVSQGAFAVEMRSVFPVESKLIGLHGGLSRDELLVPLLAVLA
jgi:Type I phosphodiesterase / nucleotide pyrophosphatase